MIYAMGRPVPTLRTWPELFDLLERGGRVLVPAIPRELKGLKERTDLEIEVLETISGFNLSRGARRRCTS